MFVGLVGFLIDLFNLIRPEEAFHRRVVVAVALAAHALKAAERFESLPIGMAGELCASIAVQYEARLRLSKSDCLVERAQG